MTFSYDPTLSSDRDYLRSVLSDTIEDDGPFPKDANFANAELDGYLSRAGSINGAYIIAANRLAAAWSSHAKAVRGTSLSVDAKNIADQWRKNARDAKTEPVDGSGATTAFKVFNAS